MICVKFLSDKIIRLYSNYDNWWPYFSDKSEIIVSSILTQNTSWKNVVKSLYNLKKFIGDLSLERIVKLPQEELEMFIKPSGFYKSKSKTILSISTYILKTYGSFQRARNYFRSLANSGSSLIEKIRKVKEFRDEILKIKGIGKETADSILLYSIEVPSFVVDSYTVRIVNRVFDKTFNKNKHYDYLKNLFEINISSNISSYIKLSSRKHNLLDTMVALLKILHAGFVEIGKNFCGKKTTFCAKCPLSNLCLFSMKKQ